jgi:hypothetical protein
MPGTDSAAYSSARRWSAKIEFGKRYQATKNFGGKPAEAGLLRGLAGRIVHTSYYATLKELAWFLDRSGACGRGLQAKHAPLLHEKGEKCKREYLTIMSFQFG